MNIKEARKAMERKEEIWIEVGDPPHPLVGIVEEELAGNMFLVRPKVGTENYVRGCQEIFQFEKKKFLKNRS